MVLIVGAGPTGLVLALTLARHKIPFRIIDKNRGPGLASRAIGVQARTLEFYHQLGFADEVVKGGIQVNEFHLREGGREIVRFSLKDMGQGISPYPYLLSYPQDDHEKFLGQKLASLGILVEWNVELVSFTQDSAMVHAVLKRGGEEEQVEASYICGCDGAHSKTREILHLGFPGGTYEQMFYVADVKVKTDTTDIYGNLGPKLFALMMPVRSTGNQRLIGLVSPELSSKKELCFDDVRASAEHLIGFKVDSVNWFSSYRVHHRVVEHFRGGRAFVLGDAGHIHSPVGAQGMNTGIGDAFNLGWKLAQVLQGRAHPHLLGTYEEERLPFARTLVATTDRIFQGVITQGLSGKILRTWLLPKFVEALTSFPQIRRLMFNLISQVRIHYRDSGLSEGRAGRLRGGDRLPWAGDNFDPLRSLDWQVHVYGEAGSQFVAGAKAVGLPVHVFKWNELVEKARFKKNAAYLVRPDGYIALALPDQDLTTLRKQLSRFAITCNQTRAN